MYLNDNLLYQICFYYNLTDDDRTSFIYDIIEYYNENEYSSINRDKCYNYWIHKFKDLF